MYYWWNYFRAVLPSAVWMLTCAVPALVGVVLARKELRSGNRSRGIVFVVAGLAAGSAALLMVGPFLLHTVGSSTDALIWVVAPIWSSVVLGIVVALGLLIVARTNGSHPVRSSTGVNAALLGPSLLVACLLVSGIIRYSFQNGGMKLAEQATDPALIRQVYYREGAASSNSGVQLFIAGNEATPADILDELSRSNFAFVRVHVAANRNTSPATQARLAADTNSNVRSAAQRHQPAAP
jgi:hypothetical protein